MIPSQRKRDWELVIYYRKNEYEKYFKELGINNIAIFSDRFIDTPPDANCLEEVAAVFATPPNSYSAVADPIDLVKFIMSSYRRFVACSF